MSMPKLEWTPHGMPNSYWAARLRQPRGRNLVGKRFRAYSGLPIKRRWGRKGRRPSWRRATYRSKRRKTKSWRRSKNKEIRINPNTQVTQFLPSTAAVAPTLAAQPTLPITFLDLDAFLKPAVLDPNLGAQDRVKIFDMHIKLNFAASVECGQGITDPDTNSAHPLHGVNGAGDQLTLSKTWVMKNKLLRMYFIQYKGPLLALESDYLALFRTRYLPVWMDLTNDSNADLAFHDSGARLNKNAKKYKPTMRVIKIVKIRERTEPLQLHCYPQSWVTAAHSITDNLLATAQIGASEAKVENAAWNSTRHHPGHKHMIKLRRCFRQFYANTSGTATALEQPSKFFCICVYPTWADRGGSQYVRYPAGSFNPMLSFRIAANVFFTVKKDV